MKYFLKEIKITHDRPNSLINTYLGPKIICSFNMNNLNQYNTLIEVNDLNKTQLKKIKDELKSKCDELEVSNKSLIIKNEPIKTFSKFKEKTISLVKTLEDILGRNNLNKNTEFISSMKESTFEKGTTKIKFNSKYYINSQNIENDLIIYPRTNQLNDNSLYKSIFDERFILEGNRFTKSEMNPFYFGFDSDISTKLETEAKDYFFRGHAILNETRFIKEKEDKLDTFIEAYKDLERAHRIIKFVYENNTQHLKNSNEQVDLRIMNSYLDIFNSKTEVAYNIFMQKELFFEAQRIIKRNIFKINNFDKKLEELESFYLPEDDLFQNPYYEMNSYESTVLDNIDDLFDNSHMKLKLSQLLLKDNFKRIIFQNNLPNELIKTHLEPQVTIPVFDKLFLFKNHQDYKKSKLMTDIYHEIISKKDYLGFETNNSFMFDKIYFTPRFNNK